MKFYSVKFFENMSINSSFDSNLTIMTVLHMKIFVHLWQHLAEFFVQTEMFQTEDLEKIKTHLMFKNFFPKIVQFMK